MKIRKGKLSDLELLLSTLNGAPELNANAEGQDYTLKWVKSAISDRKRNIVLIAEESKEIAGFLFGELWEDKGYSFLNDLYVFEKYRKQGVASKLNEEYEKICKKKGIHAAISLVLTSNVKMQEFQAKRSYMKGKEFYFYSKKLK